MPLSGPITGDAIPETLRSLSYKRRNGVLALDYDNCALRIAFQEGKIVEAHNAAENAAVAMCKRLVEAECLPKKVIDLVQQSGINSEQLYDLLVEKNYVSSEEFWRAKRSYELDLLISLRELDYGTADFTSKLIRPDPRSAIGVFPGQLILDLFELELDLEQINSLCGGLDNEELLIRQIDGVDVTLPDDERMVLDLAHGGETPKKIFKKSLLSEVQIVQALLSLRDQQLIEVTENTGKPEQDDFEQTISGDLSDEELDMLVDKAVGELLDFTGQEQSRAEEPSNDPAEAQDTGAEQQPYVNGAASEESAAEIAEPQVAPARAAKKRETRADSHSSLLERIRAFNYRLLDVKTQQRVVLIGSLLYLLSFALLGADLLESWFTALSVFTSNS